MNSLNTWILTLTSLVETHSGFDASIQYVDPDDDVLCQQLRHMDVNTVFVQHVDDELWELFSPFLSVSVRVDSMLQKADVQVWKPTCITHKQVIAFAQEMVKHCLPKPRF